MSASVVSPVFVGRRDELAALAAPLARTTPADDLADLLGPAGPGLARLLPELVPGAAAPAPRADIQAAQLAELVLGLLGRLAAVAPVMFVVEDLHWADQSTLELLAFLARSLRGARVLLVGTYRSDELHRRHPLRPLSPAGNGCGRWTGSSWAGSTGARSPRSSPRSCGRGADRGGTGRCRARRPWPAGPGSAWTARVRARA